MGIIIKSTTRSISSKTMELTKKIRLIYSHEEEIDSQLQNSVLFASETNIKAGRKISLITDHTDHLTFDESSSQEDIYAKLMLWFNEKGVREGNPEEVFMSVNQSHRKEISQLKTKSYSVIENRPQLNRNKPSLSISL